MEPRVLIEDATNAIWVEPGYLIYGRGSDLMAQGFDVDRLEITGEPIPLSPRKLSFWEPKNFIPFAAADNGTIVYLPESHRESVVRWYGRDGRPLEIVGPASTYTDPRVSSDGKQIAWVEARSPSTRTDIWLRDVELERNRKLTLESGDYESPTWSPDGKRLAFRCQPKRVQDVCVKTIDEPGAIEILYESKNWTVNGNWGPTGLILSDQDPDTKNDIWIVDVDETNTPRLLVGTPYSEVDPRLSPDGRWFLYVSDETGRQEVYLRETRESSQQWQISFEGGVSPRWRGDGREIFFASPNGNVMSVSAELEPTFRAQKAQVLFALPDPPDYLTPLFEDVSPDGQRILLNLPVEGRASVGFHAIFNWTALLGG
jgi:dipeptidyl aminopeptidase/acylaminoacyl peptidase